MMVMMGGTAQMEAVAVASTMGLMRTAALTVVTMKVATTLETVGATGVLILRVVTTLVMRTTVRRDGVTLRVRERMLMMEVEEETGEVDTMEIPVTPKVTGQMATPMSMAVDSMMAETMAVGETGSTRLPRK